MSADINEIVQAKLAELVDSGKVEEIIEAKLTKTIDDAMGDVFNSWSDFGKELKKNVIDDLNVNLNEINFSEYSRVVLNMTEGILNSHVTEMAGEKLQKQLNDLFQEPPASINFSEIIKAYIEDNHSDDPCSCDEAEHICLIFEQRDSASLVKDFLYVGLHPNGQRKHFSNEKIKSYYECNLALGFRLDSEESDCKTGRLWRVMDREHNDNAFMPTCMRGTSRLLYQLYCAGSKIVFDKGLDTDDYDLYYPGRDY